jgi:hypothetical protein
VVALLAAALGWILAAHKYGREAAKVQSEQTSDTLAKLEARLAKLEQDCSNAVQPVENPLIASLAALIKGQQESDGGAQMLPVPYYLDDDVQYFPPRPSQKTERCAADNAGPISTTGPDGFHFFTVFSR